MDKVKNKKLRKLASKKLLYQITNQLRMACIEKAMEEIDCGEWNFIKEVRLQGVLHVCKHARIEDLNLSILAWLVYQNDLHIDFSFLPKDNPDIKFTDIGAVGGTK